ncbi:UDP-glycosyltransferase 72B1 isoform X2 [Physcomitrium patens]|nr:UDP-glycosyltransferase 72B1-like isoform X2 [Physcomitrium patens]XP_024368208.1 UDP-glycosyltransferase 72B1-like isoform X2 [Physcomitrium patens]XP_024368209.1 UDP-glycosyltransferase 72B1-like isoform X2 [Physcomitrium patens]PNR59243.1 hypothetical protein PHYPA_002034 [Physcomitrium patens]|eukprot:XP_024368207.1 UDP-glycosyltransferase 72B1-like isoform X2 [Physcomitrella patens]
MGSLPKETSPLAPHVILFPCPMHSHCVPFILMAKKIIALGVKVTFISIEHVISLLQATEGKLLASEPENLRLLAISNGEGYKPSDSPLLLTSTISERTSDSFTECLERLMQGSNGVDPHILEWGPPRCVIFDLFLGSMVKLADQFNLPSYIFWTTTATSLAVMMHTAVLRAHGHIPLNLDDTDNLRAVEIPCIPPVHPFEFIGATQNSRHVMHVLLSSYPDYHVHVRGILVNSVHELESSVFEALNEHYVGAEGSKLRRIIPVGPTIPKSVFFKETNQENNANCSGVGRDPILQWLDTQPSSSVIYISFGSIATLTANQLVEMALGLEASGQRFVWILRPPSDPSMIAANSEAYSFLPPGFQDRVKGTGIIVTHWAPQVQILQHPSTGGFLTHCGWNSILESIGAGVPMLAWPIQAEQMINTRWIVEEVRAAFALRRDPYSFVDRNSIDKGVRLLICSEEGQAAKKNVLHLRDKLLSSFGDNGLSAKCLKSFVEELEQLHAQ